ncbi:hypothetical protein B0H17DRAFT_1200238 [Mycena rosella]|uniref:Uncharacterized protein n=1 Tax=Mycena rosella TaxID=1033263 RepID=A0AAD7DJ25_MYCRO|nr:hypothetical protein B0H17DRAFT_1200238 [Mycena rosella]
MTQLQLQASRSAIVREESAPSEGITIADEHVASVSESTESTEIPGVFLLLIVRFIRLNFHPLPSRNVARRQRQSGACFKFCIYIWRVAVSSPSISLLTGIYSSPVDAIYVWDIPPGARSSTEFLGRAKRLTFGRKGAWDNSSLPGPALPTLIPKGTPPTQGPEFGQDPPAVPSTLRPSTTPDLLGDRVDHCLLIASILDALVENANEAPLREAHSWSAKPMPYRDPSHASVNKAP